jgi:4-hydroxy-tetrahydrodipicolinate synthase
MAKNTRIADGVWPVMLTPFLENKEIDWDCLDHLVDWYIDAGVSGLFAVCLSSEMHHLSPDERIRLAGRVVKRANERVPVVTAGAFADSIDAQADMVKQCADTGAAAVVLTTNQIGKKGNDDGTWQKMFESLLAATGEIPLGLYECPDPFPRLLSPDLLKWAADTGRFRFFKDTCCDPVQLEARIRAVRNTPLRLFNANAQTLLGSLRAGAAGYSSIDANFYPELYVRLCRIFPEDPQAAESLQAFLSVANMATRHKYPLSAKIFLALRGLPIKPFCRVSRGSFTPKEETILGHLLQLADQKISHITTL